MKKNYILLIVGCLFFLALTYFSIWWIVLAILIGLASIAYRIHCNLINQIEARTSELELELAEKSGQIEKWLRNEKIMRRRMEEIQQSKTAVLNKLSHDIRNPMNSMMGMASLLGQTSLNTEQEKYLDAIRNCGKKMMTAINDILLKDMLSDSVGETGKAIPNQTDFDIRDCIEDVMGSLSAKAEKAGIELLCDVGYDIPAHLVGDESRLRQVLLNLIENAIKNTTSGEIIVTVAVEPSLKKEDVALTFEVRDTGQGMTDYMLNKIKMSLSHADASDIVHGENAGLGLIISNRLVTIMGGTLLIRSKIKEGTSALFNIVVRNSTIPQKRNPLDNFVGLFGKKILLIVNNSAKRKILISHLEHWKFNPTPAKTGKQALEILSADNAFDLIIMDYELSDTDGVQLMQGILKQYPRLPGILMYCANDELHRENKELFKSILSGQVRQNMLHVQVLSALIPKDQNMTKEQTGFFTLPDKFSEQYPLRILIAEDDQMNQLFAVKILNRLGYKPAVAKDGKEVLEMVSLERFDLILMDVEMPMMDGLEATRMIRLCLETQPVIIAMTANAMQGDREICLKSGMDDYLSKPVELEELVRILEKWALAGKVSL
jgi:CheY-like chemotaxis protein/signal transduction histidine kinase